MSIEKKSGAIPLKQLLGWLVTGVLLIAAVSGNAEERRPTDTSAPQNFFSTLTQPEQAWLREHPVIRVAQDPSWPPIEFTDERGAQSGMTADYLRLVEERLGVKFERVPNLSWQEAYARMQRWEIDLTTTVAVTAEREKFWAFTKPYMTMPIVVVTRADVTYIADLRELAGKKVAVVDGYVTAFWIARDFPEIQLVRVKTTAEALDLLQRGEVLACVENMLVVGYYLAEQKITKLKIVGTTHYNNAQCMAVRKDWAILAGILDQALDSVSPTEREAIYRRWLPLNYEPGLNYTRLWQIAASFAAILLGLVAWNWKLAREIRNRKQAEAALRQSQSLLHAVTEGTSDAIFVKDLAGRYLMINAAATRIVGRPIEEVIGRDDTSLFPPDEARRVIAGDRGVMESASVQTYEELVTSGGVARTFLSTKGQVRDAQGKVIGLFGIARDITERKQAEAAIRESEERFRSVTENMSEGVQLFDAKGDMIYQNSASLRIHGFDRQADERIEGGVLKATWKAWDETGRPLAPDEWPMTRIFRDGRIRNQVLRTRRVETGHEFWASANGTSVYNAAGKLVLAFITIRDITDRKRAEASLRRTERALRMVTECNQELVRASSETELLQAICRILVDRGGYRMAWVGFAELNEAKSVRPLAQAGFDAGYLDTVNITWADDEHGRGPTGTAIRTGQPVLARDIPSDPAYGPWRAAAIQRGYVSSATLPLIGGERTFGALMVYAAEADAFNAEEVALLGELAGDLAYGIAALRNLAERAEADRAMKNSEARYRRLFETAKDGILILNATTGRIVDANPFLLELLGYARATFIGKQLWELGFFKDIAASEANFRELQAKDYIRYDDLALETSDGRRIEVEFVSNGYLVGNHRVIQCNIRDISARKLAEKATIASETRYRRLFETAKDGILILDAGTGMIVDVNPFLVELLGYSHEVFLGKKVWDLGFFKNLIANEANFVELQAKEYIRYEDMALETSDGRRIEVEFVSNVYLVDGHKVIQCNIRDMTEHARADEKIHQSLVELEQAQQVLLKVVEAEKAASEQLRKLSVIIEQAPLSVVITDLAGAIEYVNPRFSLVTGYTSAEALGQNPRILKSGQTPPEVYRAMWKALSRREAWTGELSNRTKSGEIFLETVVIAPVVDQQGRPTHYVALKDDITANKRHEADLSAKLEREHEMSEMKTRFISVTSHEFRTPMAAAMGSVEILANHLDRLSPEKRRELLARITTSLERMAAMLDEILLLNRIDANRVQTQLALLDLGSFVQHAIEEIRLGDRDQHRFEFYATGDAMTFPSDANLLQHILSNLLSNAVRYSPAGTLVTVQLTSGVEQAELFVEDKGIGISESDRERIFEPFERGSNVGTIKGTGLGLNIVKRMIALLGGTVTLTAVESGGSRFTITLPRHPMPTLPQ